MTYVVTRFGLNDTRYSIPIKQWWGKKTGSMLGDYIFSDYGYMVTDDEGRMLVASFLYPIMGCEVALMGFPIANPELEVEERRGAISMLATYVEVEAKKLNYKYILSYAGSEGAKAMFDRLGYLTLDKDVVNYGKRL